MPVPCVGQLDYSRAIQQWWRTSHTIVNVEHDHDPTEEQIQELVDCPHSLCTFAYMLHHLAPPHYAQRDGGPGYGEWISAGVEWCGFTGIGFCKITPDARAGVLDETPWLTVDCAVSRATEGSWHVHWPEVAHWHV